MKYENIEPIGSTHILIKDDTGGRIVCPVADLCCWEARDRDNPMIYIVGGYRVTRETFDDVVSYLRER
jgi:hypothetical protein